MTSVKQAGKTLLFRILRFGFRLVPMSEPARDRLRQQFLNRFSQLVPPGPRARSAPLTIRRARIRSDEPAIGYVPYRQEPLPSPLPATLVAFYLPQFHPIAENDAWWGKGFTEWRNVARALPQFEGHAQPRLPADLGFYDLRNVDTMREQVKLASEYGIGAFCFYFYWFSGRTLLEQPLRQWLRDPSLELPFCLCWANESWTRRWDGRPGDTLIGQFHTDVDDIAFIAKVAEYLRDPRYLRVDGKPLLLLYRPDLLPDPRATAVRWRHWCADNGVGEIHLAYVQGFERPAPADIGFDAAIEFPPNLSNPADLTAQQHLLNPRYAGQALDWRELASEHVKRSIPSYRQFPGVNCGWDNEPRRSGTGRTYLHASPRGYRDWLQHTIERRLPSSDASERLIFINAWNEWAEGAVLEPDSRLGHAWLQATRDALKRTSDVQVQVESSPRPCVVIHAWYLDAFDEILGQLQLSKLNWRIVVTTIRSKFDEVHSALSRRGLTAVIEVGENRGRDVLPFLRVANRLLDDGGTIVLKLHTKRSPHLRNGDAWRHELVSALTPLESARGIFEAFQKNPKLGLVAPQEHLLPITKFLGGNERNVSYLTSRMGIPSFNGERDIFPSGSMFWIRLEALRPLLDEHLDEWVFEPEEGQIDGTMAHAVERVFCLAVHSAGFHSASSGELVSSSVVRSAQRHYPYARRD